MAALPFVISPTLSAIAVAYHQQELIADQVFPRVPVLSEVFDYSKYDKGDYFQTPDTEVSRKGAPNQIDWASTTLQSRVVDQALDAPIPNKDIMAYDEAKAAGTGYVAMTDPQSRYTKLLIAAVLNRRESRAASLLFNAASYGTANKVTLSGTSQWSDYTNSDPMAAIEDALDSMVVRPNHATFGQIAWSKTKRNPMVIKRLYGSASTRGSARLIDFAEELGLKEIYIGQAFLNTAAKGQPATLARAWGPHASFFYKSQEAEMEGVVTFGVTAQWGDRFGGTIIDPDIGARGGVRVRTGESVKELITANDMGFLFTNVA